MAPEMAIMLTQTRHEKKGYNNTVDWWSLGATMFKLATVVAIQSSSRYNSHHFTRFLSFEGYAPLY